MPNDYYWTGVIIRSTIFVFLIIFVRDVITTVCILSSDKPLEEQKKDFCKTFKISGKEAEEFMKHAK